MKTTLKKILLIIGVIFALIGMLFTFVFVGMQLELFNVRGGITQRNEFFLGNNKATTTVMLIDYPCVDTTKKVCDWKETPEWGVIKNGLQKDEFVIKRVSEETGIPKRMIAAVVIPEQARFFTANREIFKKYFEPMKILGSMSQFSLGVSGIKEKTALEIEVNLANKDSDFYPGEGLDKLIAYEPNANREKELFNRLTDPKDHYYSYLYTALYIREVESQWKSAGFDISKNPEIAATLFNIGFDNSKPNTTPAVGGTAINLGGKTYLYGELSSNFYNSEELADVFMK